MNMKKILALCIVALMTIEAGGCGAGSAAPGSAANNKDESAVSSEATAITEEAAFGKSLTAEQWASISEIKDIYEDVLFTAPLVAANVANPLLKEIQSELGEENRKFSFLCGHDSNIASVLASLGATDYELSATVERKTPIGGKLVFGRWTDAEGKEFISVDMVYQTTEQLQNVSLLDLENPPMSETVALDGLLANEQGLYAAEEVEARIKQAIDEYDEICGEYAMDAAA